MRAPLIRLMAGYDPAWKERLAEAEAKSGALMDKPGALSDEERAELAASHRAMQAARESRFRTTAEYRDHTFSYCRELLERQCIDMPLPSLPDDCTREDVDRVVDLVWRAVEVTNSETF